MRQLMRRALVGGFLVALGAALLPGTVSIWMDERGHTYLTDREIAPAPDSRLLSPGDLAVEWGGRVTGPPTAPGDSSAPDDRLLRELRAARADLERGELQTGVERLRRLYAAHPNQPGAAWLLAQAERRRGRLEAARELLEVLVSTAEPHGSSWRQAARAEIADIDADLELERAGADGFRSEQYGSPNFLIRYDHRFAARDYGERVARLLEAARDHVIGVLGRGLDEPLDVHLYTKGHYLDSYQHRFGFATVGFYDGAIHVVAARQPRARLQALLLHEYVHAVFRDAVGSDQPFFLNEGIADREEERLRGRDGLSRGEWRQLVDAHRADTWIPLESIVSGFSGLEGKRALLAYVESRAAVGLIEERHPGALARWLARCAEGQGWQAALAAETGWDAAGLDRALHEEVTSRFPADPLSTPAQLGGQG